MSLYAFTQLNGSHVLIQYSQKTACDAEDVLEKSWHHESSTEKTMEQNNSSTHQKVIEEAIPRFHQQLSSFVPF